MIDIRLHKPAMLLPGKKDVDILAALGWEYAMAHTEAIIDLLLGQNHVQKTRDHLRYEADSNRKIMLPDRVQIGHMNPGRWRHIARTYGKLGLLDADFNPDGFLYDPFAAADPTRFIRMIVAKGEGRQKRVTHFIVLTATQYRARERNRACV